MAALLVLAAGASGPALARDLTFRDRVEAQRAIERIYHAHQIGVRESFEDAVPEDVLERRVLDYLRKSAALEALWSTPITGAMLAAEGQRIARRTHFPERLAALSAALGHDPLLLEECLYRPALVDRLTRSYFEWDRRIHEQARRAGQLPAEASPPEPSDH